MPVRFFITSGTTADCTIAMRLIDGFQAKYLLVDRGYDTDAIFQKATKMGMIPVIPPRKTVNTRENTTDICTNSAILLRMLFCFSKDGVVLQLVTQKTSLLSLLLSRFVVLRFGSLLIDDTI